MIFCKLQSKTVGGRPLKLPTNDRETREGSGLEGAQPSSKLQRMGLQSCTTSIVGRHRRETKLPSSESTEAHSNRVPIHVERLFIPSDQSKNLIAYSNPGYYLRQTYNAAICDYSRNLSLLHTRAMLLITATRKLPFQWHGAPYWAKRYFTARKISVRARTFKGDRTGWHAKGQPSG